MERKITKFKKGMIPWNKGCHIPTGLIKAKDITGNKFNRWTAIERTSKRNGYWQWLFQCECGNKRELSIVYVTSGLSKSCGCLKLEKLKIGHPHTIESKRKLSESKKGDKSWNWKGGISSSMQKIRNSLELKLWKKACLERDNYTCQKTGVRGGKLAVHHIKNFSQYIELRTSITNGITLGFEIHKIFHKIYGIKNNTREQLDEFINNKNI